MKLIWRLLKSALIVSIKGHPTYIDRLQCHSILAFVLQESALKEYEG